MNTSLREYERKRNFNSTLEPKAKKSPTKDKHLRFAVQHHLASRDHYDFRLEWKGVLISWAVPKGPSYNPDDKRLAVKVEDHPYDYRDFEGIIPAGEYGGGTVMLWDEGEWEPRYDFEKGLEEGSLKINLYGTRLKGKWALVRLKSDEDKDNWLLIKEKDGFAKKTSGISRFKRSIKTDRTMKEIADGVNKDKLSDDVDTSKKVKICGVEITNPDRIVYPEEEISKLDLVIYYEKVAARMLKYVEGRLISVVRCNKGIKSSCFFKKHPLNKKDGIKIKTIKNSEGEKDDYYFISNKKGLIYEAQLGTIEFHIWGSRQERLEHPDMMVFDLDPDEGMNIEQVRQGVRDLKKVLDKLGLKSFLKTSGGKGYHVVVPFKSAPNWKKFHDFAKNVAKYMESQWPDRYTSNVRKSKRKGKIFIDWIRNGRGATSVAPYSLRARPGAKVSMPISWKELETVEPNSIDVYEALTRLKKADPWKSFFHLNQSL